MRSVALSAFLVVAVGCASTPRVAPRAPVENFPVDSIVVADVAALFQGQLGDQALLELRTRNRPGDDFHRSRIEVRRGDEVVQTTTLDPDAPGWRYGQPRVEVLLDPGSYELTATSSDGGRTVVVAEVTVLRSHCFIEPSKDDRRTPARAVRLFGTVHHGTRVVFDVDGSKPRLWVPRAVADVGFARPTRITWRQGTAQKITTARAKPASWTRSASVDSSLADVFRYHCGHLWQLDDVSHPIPDEVWRAGGRWTARLVSPGAATVEVDLDVGPSIALDRRFGRRDSRRSPPLAPRVVETTADERAWQAEEEARMVIEPPEVGAFVPSLPITPALLRAAHRSPDVAFDYYRYTRVRLPTRSGDVDIASEVRRGVDRGDTIAASERRARRFQAGLDADARAENAYRRKEARRLHAKLVAAIKKHGAPFTDRELPDPFSPPPADQRRAPPPAIPGVPLDEGAATIELRASSCQLLLNGTPVPLEPPPTNLRLPPANHLLVLRHPQHGTVWQGTLIVTPGKVTKIRPDDRKCR